MRRERRIGSGGGKPAATHRFFNVCAAAPGGYRHAIIQISHAASKAAHRLNKPCI